MINIRFFSKYREQAGCASLVIEVGPLATVADVIRLLKARPDIRVGFLDDQNMIIAVNQMVATSTTSLKMGDEVAFFPPVSGG